MFRLHSYSDAHANRIIEAVISHLERAYTDDYGEQLLCQGSPALVMVENDLGGRLRIQNSDFVAIVNNRVSSGSLIVRSSGLLQVTDNRVKSRSIRVSRNWEAVVNRNDAGLNIQCEGNGKLDSFLNHADGNDNCDE